MKFKISAIAAAVAAATLSTAASAEALDFHGYARTGVGSSSKGGSLVCYWMKGGSMGHYRLGNECDTYMELQFDANLAEKDNTQFKLHTMLAAGTQQLQDWEQNVPAWRQIWGEATNIGSGPLANTNLWVGKRYYKRNDVHMTDFFYNQVTGPGAGIENVDVAGFAKFSYAYFRYQPDYSGTNPWGYNPDFVNGGVKATPLHDLRLEAIQLGDFGSLDFFAQIVTKDNRDDDTGAQPQGKGGWAFTAQHTIGVLGGFNRAVFQYAADGANLDGTAKWWADDTVDYEGYRFLDHLVFEQGAFNGSAFFGYEQDKKLPWYAGATQKEWTLGARAWYHFNELYSVGGEYGHNDLKPTDGKGGNLDSRKLDKITVAAQITPGKGFWSRPSLRAYYTYAKWNDAYRDQVPGGAACTGRDCGTNVQGFADATNGSTYGFQMEAWW